MGNRPVRLIGGPVCHERAAAWRIHGFADARFAVPRKRKQAEGGFEGRQDFPPSFSVPGCGYFAKYFSMAMIPSPLLHE